jgi:phosphatidylglycerophosphate synthase
MSRRRFFFLCSFMPTTGYYLVNAITLYRAVSSVFLLYFIWTQNLEVFKWLLAISFFTDAIDGFLARKFRVSSIMGARLDSLADDLTLLMGILGIFRFEPEFVQQELAWIIILIAMYLVQTTMALVRYGRVSSFHTYMAKGAAILQGCFLILLFFLPEWPLTLFHLAAVFTILDIVEEMILVMVLPEWKTDVKGLYWVKRKKREKNIE